MGLPAELRLRRSPDITAAVRRGRRVRAGGLVVHGAHRPHGPVPDAGPGPGPDRGPDRDDVSRPGDRPRPAVGPRVAFVAPRSCGPAVRRNRARRRVQESFRDAVATGALSADVDLVVRLLPEATGAGSAELAGWLASALRRLGVLA